MPRRDKSTYGGLRRGSKAHIQTVKRDTFHARMAVKFGASNRSKGLSLFTEDIKTLRNYFNIRRRK